MNGYVNKHNCCIWDDANPHEVHQVAIHPQKVLLAADFVLMASIGPYFFENDVGKVITITDEGYRTMITDLNLKRLKLNDMDVDDM
ncbi:hypothetical protein Trydic_g22382 [Trypoxylus dichotomus]